MAVGNSGGSSPTGQVIETTNGGNTWAYDTLPSGTGPLQAVSCPAVDECVAVGESTSGAGRIVTQSGGSSFSKLTVPSGVGEVDAVSCPTSGSTCGAVGYDKSSSEYDDILASSSGSWSVAATISVSGDSPLNFTTIDCFSSTTCEATGQSYEGPIFTWTTNTWSSDSTSVDEDGSPAYLEGISCTSPTTCLSVGLEEQFFGGESTWTEGANASGQELGDDCISTTVCAVVGDETAGSTINNGDGDVFSTVNGGLSWWSEPVPTGTGTLFGISCTSAGICFSVGETLAGAGTVLDDNGDPLSGPIGGLLQVAESYGLNPGLACLPCTLKELKAIAPAEAGAFLNGFGGDPVDTASGNLTESANDAAVASYGPALDFVRTYNSELADSETSPGPLGYGWTDNWQASLSITSGNVTVTEGTGAALYFQAPVSDACPTIGQVDPEGAGTSGSYCAAPRVTAMLVHSGSNYVLTFAGGTSDTFNSSGQLTGVTDNNGASDAIAYNMPTPSHPSSTCDSSYATSCDTITGPGSTGDRYLVLAFNASGEIVRVTDPLYQQWVYGYDSDGNLTSVEDPMTYVTMYGYSDDPGGSGSGHDLLTIVRPNNYSEASSLTSSVIAAFCGGGAAPGIGMVFCYDSSGRVVRQGDAMGRVTTFAYSGTPNTAGGGSTVVTDPDGNTTTDVYQYNELLSRTIYPNSAGGSSTWTYVRDPNSLLPVEIINPDNADSNGVDDQMSYNSQGNLTSYTDADGNTWTYSYDTTDNLDVQNCSSLPEAVSTCQAASPPSAVPASNTTITPPTAAPPSGVTYVENDTDGDPVWTSVGQYPIGSSTATNISTSYFLYAGQSVTVGTRITCSASPPEHGLPCATINPDTTVTQLGYDSDGDITSSSTPDGNASQVAETTWSYYGNGQVEDVISPLGHLGGTDNLAKYTTNYVYNADDEVKQVNVDLYSVTRTTNYGYDGDGNETSVENAVGGTTSITYDADDEASLVTLADGNETLTCYDGDGNVAQVVPAVGVAGPPALTPASCPTSYSSGYGDRLASDATTYQYDALGDMTVSTAPAPAGQTGSETTTNYYDAVGRLSETVAPPTDPVNDPLGLITYYSYDPAGRLVQSQVPTGGGNGVTTSYCYDPNGDVTVQVSGVPGGSCELSNPWQLPYSANQQATSYTYDSTGDLLTTTRPVTDSTIGSTTDTYDPLGQVLTSTHPNGTTATMSYTPLGEVSSVSYSDGVTPGVTNKYDALGELTKMTDGTGVSQYSYDPFGDVASYENGAGETVSYAWNAISEPTQVTYPLPPTATWNTAAYVKYGYDTTGRLMNFTDLAGTETKYLYTPDDIPKSITYPSSIGKVSLSYDSADNPESIAFAKGGSTLLSYGYTYEKSGAIAAETDASGTGVSPSYSYDQAGRVLSMTPSGGSATTYSYDNLSDLTTLPDEQTASYDNSAGELTGIGSSISLTYNADGDRLKEANGSTALDTATWNGADELTSYDNDSAGVDMTGATYDGNGLRQTSTFGSSTQDYLWGTTTPVPELLEDATNLYIYGPGSTPVEQMSLTTGAASYLVSDALGSVRAVVTGSGVAGSTSYDAYGTPASTGVSAKTPFGYAGGYTDATGLVYLVSRYYDPSTGQFLSVDPLVTQTGQAYDYAGGDPVDNTDPSGLQGGDDDQWNDPSPEVFGDAGPVNPLAGIGWLELDAIGSELCDPAAEGEGSTLVYRSASGTPDSMTPRPGIDTDGLSANVSPDAYPSGVKVQVIDTGQLDTLQWEIDNAETGHVSIFAGDPELMEQWAATRGTGEIHPLTEEVLNAIVDSFRNP